MGNTLFKISKICTSIVHFILFTSVFSALCALVLCMATERLLLGKVHHFLSPLHFFIFGSALVVYNVHYLIKKSTIKLSDHFAWVQKHRFWNFVFLLLGIVLCLNFLPQMPKHVWQVCIVLALFSFAYSLPVLPFKNKHRLKDIGWLKILILTLVWTMVTAALPLLYWGQSLFQFPYEILLRFVFLFILCLAFDIRDMHVDLVAGSYTLPNKFGLNKTYTLIYMLSVLFVFLAYLQWSSIHLNDRLFINIATTVSTVVGIFYVKKHPSDKNYILFVDGQMLLNGFFIWLL